MSELNKTSNVIDANKQFMRKHLSCFSNNNLVAMYRTLKCGSTVYTGRYYFYPKDITIFEGLLKGIKHRQGSLS